MIHQLLGHAASVAAVLGLAALGAARPLPAQGRPIRVLVYHDMEGLSGQDDPHSFRFDHPAAYARGRELLVADVNAVIEGLLAGGATEVHVVDAHGSGNPEPDLPAGALHPRARQIFRDRPFRQYVDLVAPDQYDAVAVVGMHAKTGSRGFASHTFTLGIALEVEGHEITETELIAYSWGRVGVPVIFGSGDDRLGEDLRAMPWIEFVVTKRATSASTAELRLVPEVHAEMRAKAARAVQNLGHARVARLDGPVRAGMRVVPPASLEPLRGIPGLQYADNRVRFEAPDFGAVYDAWMAILAVARSSYPQLLFEAVAARPDGQAIRQDYADLLFARWLDYESGRWRPPAAPVPATGRRYHGAN